MFDEIFDFERGLKETLAYSNTQKNGIVQQKTQLHLLEKIIDSQPQTVQLVNKLGEEVSQGLFHTVNNVIQQVGERTGKSFMTLTAPSFAAADDSDSLEEEKRKKKRKYQQSQGLSR